MMPSTGGKSERSVTDQLTPAGLKKSRLTAGGTHETHESVNQEDSVMSDGEPKGASASASSASSSDGDGGGSPSAAEPEGDGSAAVDVPEGEPDAWADPDSWGAHIAEAVKDAAAVSDGLKSTISELASHALGGQQAADRAAEVFRHALDDRIRVWQSRMEKCKAPKSAAK